MPGATNGKLFKAAGRGSAGHSRSLLDRLKPVKLEKSTFPAAISRHEDHRTKQAGLANRERMHSICGESSSPVRSPGKRFDSEGKPRARS